MCPSPEWKNTKRVFFTCLYFQKCPSSIRHTMGNSSVLASVYRHDVPILLSKGDVNPSEYTRLKPFTNMMGWKDVNYIGKKCHCDCGSCEFL